ncbi:MAG: helix-turn-helix transcriptional regulator [Pirellulaceae bacterium]|jgi:hypothetical protein|nr:helix-turn-helix transcriptional regulator [Pirellulaceae bacterium]MDP7016055.1 helix-turn-helix transcriptional regulator [Pirellulaceae bacterium]
MTVSFRLAQLLQPDLKKWGMLNEIASRSGVERHTIRALLDNTAKYVSFDTLTRLSDYLVEYRGFDAESLPAALFGRDPKLFWNMLAGCQQLEFCLGTRTSAEWPGSRYVMATDSRLQAVILSNLSRFSAPRHSPWPMGERAVAADEEQSVEPPARVDRAGVAAGQPHRFPDFHLVHAPPRNIRPHQTSAEWKTAIERAQEVYDLPATQTASSGLVALGSVKSNPVVEIMLAAAFDADPFVNQDQVSRASQRKCPVMFRYRQSDPQPPSFIGGTALAAKQTAKQPGIYYRTSSGKWQCSPNKPGHDTAFVFYAYRPRIGHVDVVLAGFSSLATGMLADRLDSIASSFREPQFECAERQLQIGMYIIGFQFDDPDQPVDSMDDSNIKTTTVTAIERKVIERCFKSAK